MCIPGEAHPHSRWGCAFPVRTNHNGMSILTRNDNVPHQECMSSAGMEMGLTRNGGYTSPGMHILIGNGIVPHREFTSSPGIGICLTGNAHPHRKWGCASPVMLILTGNVYPHRHVHSLCRVKTMFTENLENEKTMHTTQTSSLIFMTVQTQQIHILSSFSLASIF